jgi:thiol-disulfide isomerase/thioredoxin
MKHTKFHPVLILLFSLISHSVIGQKIYDIEIVFSGTDVSNTKIGAQVYQDFRTISLKKNSSSLIAEKIALSAKYPIIEISYFSDKHRPSFHRFFLTNRECKLAVHYDKDTDIVKIENTSGVSSFEDAGLNKFKVFAKTELENQNAYSRAYNYDFTAFDPSVQDNFDKYVKAVKDKAVQFVNKYPNLLYSTWLFTYEIVGNPRYSMDEQLDLYHKVLEQRHINSFEEKLILNKLYVNRLALNTAAPLQNNVFKDLQGSSYSISSFGKKLLLINIWATWCVPCVEEIPRLKELYAKYKTSMEIISFSTDTDEQKLRNFLKSKDIEWINVFNQPDICSAFGSDKGVPQVFLLNEKGIIVYSRKASADPTLDILEKTLALGLSNYCSAY